MEWSKKILIFSYLMLGVFIIIFLAVEDKTAAATVLCGWIVECGGATAFYFWKAKNENRSKYALKFVRELADKYGLDATARIIESVLKD
jgi:hypothetical protein|nr:MAG TPA: hypothetical protein [Bacteriophage sp.]DAO30925.1 MAG TPA: hypothetical protein [Caudoviricetes sp.]DAR23350.1 MAG TPA: hypothetical protein [Caudoviricetes sp.]